MLRSAQESVFEVVDATNEDQYWTLGVFSTLPDALIALDGRTPDDMPGGHDDYDDFCMIQIRERKYGWSDGGNVVRVREWTRDYNESTDEYAWTLLKEPPKGVNNESQQPMLD